MVTFLGRILHCANLAQECTMLANTHMECGVCGNSPMSLLPLFCRSKIIPQIKLGLKNHVRKEKRIPILALWWPVFRSSCQLWRRAPPAPVHLSPKIILGGHHSPAPTRVIS